MRKYNKKWAVAAAAAVVLLAGGGSAIAAGKSEVFKVENMVIEEKEEGVSDIAFGAPESNEWKGSKEWLEFFYEYWETDEYLDACDEIDKNLRKGIENDAFSQYPEGYNVHTQKMADKLEEILKKYNLKLEGEAVIVDSYEDLLSQMKMESFIEKPENIYMPFANIHKGGNWGGDFTMASEGGLCTGQISVCHEGILDSGLGLNLGDLSNYEEWNYVNKKGDSLNLMTNPQTDRSYIFYEGAQDFVIINLESALPKDRLEKTADAFEFSKISKAE